MTKARVIILFTTIAVVSVFGYFISMYARGYRFNQDTMEISPSGLLVLKSDPDGAEIFINGEFETATNATINLAPGNYSVSVQKDGYISWNKQLEISKEEVTEATAQLFKSAPSLSAITLASGSNPVPSRDLTKIAYVVPPNANGNSLENQGLWVMEMLNLPLGFSREPRRITDGDLTEARISWSPNGREILLTTTSGAFLLDVGTFTPQAQRINVLSTISGIDAEWQTEQEKRFNAQIEKLPEEIRRTFTRKMRDVMFSPDEEMVMYTASASATIPDNLIDKLPGASTQKETREIEAEKTYVYDLKEDKNFLVDDNSADLVITGGNFTDAKRRLSWFPSSRHLILSEDNKITVMDYDGTNKQVVYSGSYRSPHAFPTLSSDRLIILTNLGATSTPMNLYSLSIK